VRRGVLRRRRDGADDPRSLRTGSCSTSRSRAKRPRKSRPMPAHQLAHALPKMAPRRRWLRRATLCTPTRHYRQMVAVAVGGQNLMPLTPCRGGKQAPRLDAPRRRC
jgi:hypothetical protein